MTKEITTLTTATFDTEIAHGNWIIDFWAEWCGPCHAMAPHFEAAAKELAGKVKFGKVDVDSEIDLAERFQVLSIPTLLFFKDGEQVNRVSGAIPKEQILQDIGGSF